MEFLGGGHFSVVPACYLGVYNALGKQLVTTISAISDIKGAATSDRAYTETTKVDIAPLGSLVAYTVAHLLCGELAFLVRNAFGGNGHFSKRSASCRDESCTLLARSVNATAPHAKRPNGLE